MPESEAGFAPDGFKPKVYVPERLFDKLPVKTPRRKTSLMGRVEYNADSPIIPLFKYWREELGWTNKQIAKATGVSSDTVGKWVKQFELGPRAKRKPQAA
jgi:DNA-binding XRE family transcriptional regulator